jgi:hypothetical protein
MAADSGFINGPIPGMSLTTEPGNRPWENPPSMTTVEEAIEFYTKKILNEENHDDLLDIIEVGLPVRNIANMMQTTSVMKGRHTLDVGFLVLPVIEELIMTVADINGVEYKTSVEDIIKKNSISRREARMIAREVFSKKQKPKEEEEQVIEEPKGLMSKRNQKEEA